MSLRPPTPRLPQQDGAGVKALCQQLVPSGKPVTLTLEAESWAIPNECYANVARKIQESGGSNQYGWMIWEGMPRIMLEAEFHSVWVDKDGSYHDISPKALPELRQILFLPDPVRKYEGRQIDNVRVALKNDSLVKRFIRCAERYFEIRNQGELADYHGDMSAHVTDEMLAAQQQLKNLLKAILEKYNPH